MENILTVLLLLWSSGLQALDIHDYHDPVRLVGGSSRCTGRLEMKHEGQWRPVYGSTWTLKAADKICRQVDCGAVVSTGEKQDSSPQPVWAIKPNCLSRSALWSCVLPEVSQGTLEITCLDSVRLVNGPTLCSGRLEVKSDQSNQSWSSVCEDDFDQQDAEVVCRELGCWPPLDLQGALYGEEEAPMWSKEFQCGGHESALLDCGRSDSARTTCSPGRAVGLTCSEPVRLVGGSSRCSGVLEVKHDQEWRPVYDSFWTLKEAALVCRELDCGSVISTEWTKQSTERPMWSIMSFCYRSKSQRDCVKPYNFSETLKVTCSDFLRLVGGTLCSGTLEVKSNQSGQSNQSDQSWSSVCEDDFDQQDAEVVCRELGCWPPSVLQGAPYGEGEAPMWTKEFQCGGHESALLDCRRSVLPRNTCSPGRAVGLTCSEPVRLVGGSSRCSGILETKQGDWRSVYNSDWALKEAAAACRKLDCGSAISTELRKESSARSVWRVNAFCVYYESALRDCVRPLSSFYSLNITCSDSVRLVNGPTLCSGRLEVRSDQSNQSNQSWSSVCEADFDQQDAEVVCRELDCGPPSVLQGALYGEAQAPMWTKEFQCGGHESALLDCRRSDSVRNSCSPGRAVGLTCSEPVRLVGGSSRCNGTLEVKQGEWRSVYDSGWTLKDAAAACRKLDCGSAVSMKRIKESSRRPVWGISYFWIHSESGLRDGVVPESSDKILEIACSDSVRLVNGPSLCSGRLEVMSNQTNQRWSSVCEDDFDQQDAEVVCRELGCGPPSVLQGALYGEAGTSMWTKEFQCGGHESALLDCRRSDSARNTCSPGRAVGLTCSEPVRLVGGSSRCNGTLEVKQGEWRSVYDSGWTLKDAAAACRKLDCGSAVSVEERGRSSRRPVWRISRYCAHSAPALRDCVKPDSSPISLEVTCTDTLIQPNISVSSSVDGVSEAQQQGFQVTRGSSFTVSCSIQPRFPGGSFMLTFSSCSSAHNYTQSAVNHSANFLFPAAEPTHQGNYSCVYVVVLPSHTFSSESRRLPLTVSDSPGENVKISL